MPAAAAAKDAANACEARPTRPRTPAPRRGSRDAPTASGAAGTIRSKRGAVAAISPWVVPLGSPGWCALPREDLGHSCGMESHDQDPTPPQPATPTPPRPRPSAPAPPTPPRPPTERGPAPDAGDARRRRQAEGPRRLYRSRDERVIGGVCGGLAEYFGIDPLIVRIIAVALVFAGGAGFLAYLAAWLLVPERTAPGRDGPAGRTATIAGTVAARPRGLHGAALLAWPVRGLGMGRPARVAHLPRPGGARGLVGGFR